MIEQGALDGTRTVETDMKASFFEIYEEKVYDLLSSKNALESPLNVQVGVGHSVKVEGLTEVKVSSIEEAETIIRSGIANRHIASTNMNRTSSRSHALFTLNINTQLVTSDGLLKTRLSKFTVVDLAGSERAHERKQKKGEKTIFQKLTCFKKTNSLLILGTFSTERGNKPPERRNESANINKSLLFFGNMITDLVKRETSANKDIFIRYRNSKVISFFI
jgi:hypothetical protein